MARKLLTLSKSGVLPGDLKLEGVDSKVVSLVVAGLQYPIRSYTDKEELNTMLLLEIQRLADSYGARHKVEDHILNAALNFVVSKFKFLSIAELGEAFQMAAAGNLPGVNLEMYGGKFNIKILGSVLGGYREYRKRIVARIIEVESNILNQEHVKRTAVSKRLAFDEAFPGMIVEAGKSMETWESVPVFWYEAAKRLDLLELGKEEAHAIYGEAKELAKVQLAAKVGGTKKEDERTQYRNALKELADGKDIELGKVIARKLVVWRKLINSQKSEL